MWRIISEDHEYGSWTHLELVRWQAARVDGVQTFYRTMRLGSVSTMDTVRTQTMYTLAWQTGEDCLIYIIRRFIGWCDNATICKER